MMETSVKPELLFIVGPTASGKSDLAVEIAERLESGSSEIINCDSVQFFAGLEIGSAKPSPDLLRRAPHHLIGHVPVGGAFTAGDFRREAIQVIENRVTAGVSRFVGVGGSGFYIQALEKGMHDVPDVAEGIRASLETESEAEGGWEKLYRELSLRDPLAAQKINPADRYRILRALEILRSNPEGSLTEIREKFALEQAPSPFVVRKIGVYWPRASLRERVTLRTREMLKAGLIEEVESLLGQLAKLGLSDWTPMRSVGYRETCDFLAGRLPRAELENAIVTSTMQLAKRQMTWFKRDPLTRWFDVENGRGEPLQYALELLQP